MPNDENAVSGRHKRNNTIEEKKLLGGGRRGNIGRGPGRNSEVEGRGVELGVLGDDGGLGSGEKVSCDI